MKSLDMLQRRKIIDLYREVYTLSKINHPSFLKFIGFSSCNFKSVNKPVIALEHISKGPLELFLKPELNVKIGVPSDEIRKSLLDIKLDDTKKLILLYGIAAGMSYLHSHNILHRNLKPSSIFFNDDLLPKISGFNVAKELIKCFPLDEPRKDEKLRGDKFYLAPEVLNNLEYGKPSDVYSFSILMYEIMTMKIPKMKKNEVQLKFDEKIPQCYRDLIEKCWSQDLKNRPTFDEIVSELRNNPKFITNKVNEIEYQNYINFIDNSKKNI